MRASLTDLTFALAAMLKWKSAKSKSWYLPPETQWIAFKIERRHESELNSTLRIVFFSSERIRVLKIADHTVIQSFQKTLPSNHPKESTHKKSEGRQTPLNITYDAALCSFCWSNNKVQSIRN
jgi:hypothetical protein